MLGQNERDLLLAAGLDQVDGTASSQNAEQVRYPVALQGSGDFTGNYGFNRVRFISSLMSDN